MRTEDDAEEIGPELACRELHVDDRARYRIVVRGHLNPECADWVEGMAIRSIGVTASERICVLSGELADQAALAGVLRYLYDQQLPLLSVKCMCVSTTRLAGG